MKVQIIVEQASDGKFWCYTEQGIGDVGLSAMGDSVAAAKADLMECCREARQDAEENGKTFPEVEFEYKYDLQSFFNYFSFLNVSDIAKKRASTHRSCGNIAVASKKLERRHTSVSQHVWLILLRIYRQPCSNIGCFFIK